MASAYTARGLEVMAMKDGWAEYHSAFSVSNGLWQASYLWDSGDYEQVSFRAGLRILFFRKRNGL